MSQHAAVFNRLREMRKLRGWSQLEVARRAGISRTAVSAIEIRRLVPSVSAALMLADCFGCTVDDLFRKRSPSPGPEWAWLPHAVPCRYWRAEVGGRVLSYPVEETAAGEIPHDGVSSGTSAAQVPAASPSRTLIAAGCDPAAGLLAAEYARQSGLRMIVLGRSSGDALKLLGRGLVHVAGLHLSAAGGRAGNAGIAGRQLDRPAGLVRLARWDIGVAFGPGQSAASLRQAVRGGIRWIGREAGSGARQCLDEILGRKQPTQIAHDHRGVATALRCHWADAGVCVRLVSEESGLRFLKVRSENYDLAFLKSMEEDARIQALIRVIRSPAYRRLLGELPGYDSAETGGLEWAEIRSRPVARRKTSA